MAADHGDIFAVDFGFPVVILLFGEEEVDAAFHGFDDVFVGDFVGGVGGGWLSAEGGGGEANEGEESKGKTWEFHGASGGLVGD
jgi:hypothetical protein